MEGAEVVRMVAKAHPSLAGHFPENPIVPGVIILEEVIDALTANGEFRRIVGISWVKFLAPLGPDQAFVVGFDRTAPGCVGFRCIRNGQLFARGLLEVV
jgi:3-hydroxymyristoyl/3-hydroxydecanoyl-(acyl carrier protein) dehydratase